MKLLMADSEGKLVKKVLKESRKKWLTINYKTEFIVVIKRENISVSNVLVGCHNQADLEN